MEITTILSEEFAVEPEKIQSILALASEGCTISFMAKYRQEKCPVASEETLYKLLRRHSQLEQMALRTKNTLQALAEFGKVKDSVKEALEHTRSPRELEDLISLHTPSKKSRANAAIRSEIKPLADLILKQAEQPEPLETIASRYIKESLGISSPDKALEWARQILCEEIEKQPFVLNSLRKILRSQALLTVKLVDPAGEGKGKYSEFSNFSKPLGSIPLHQYLAIQSGCRQKQLTSRLEIDDDKILASLLKRLVTTTNPTISFILESVISEAYHKTLKPAASTDVLDDFWEHTEVMALDTYVDNLINLLWQPAAGKTPLVAIDRLPDGSCLAVFVTKTGQLATQLPFSMEDTEQPSSAAQSLVTLIAENTPAFVLVAGREGNRPVMDFVASTLAAKECHTPVTFYDPGLSDLVAAHKSVSDEFAGQNESFLKTITLARFCQDPVSELTRLDVLAIPVGSHHKAIDPDKLKKRLIHTMNMVVNRLGVDINTTHTSLLKYVSGLDAKLAKAIVEYRLANGVFKNRESLLAVPGMTPKAYFLAAPFLRIFGGDNPLDATAIHPEHYELTQKMAESIGKSIADLLNNPDGWKDFNPKPFETNDVGLATLRHIANSFCSPDRDPRHSFEPLEPNQHVRSLADLKPEQIIRGRVINLASFGAFIDIGVGQKALLHRSALQPTKDGPHIPAVKIGRVLTFRVTEIDTTKNRIQVAFPLPRKPEPRPERRPQREQPHERQGRPEQQTQEQRPRREDQRPSREAYQDRRPERGASDGRRHDQRGQDSRRERRPQPPRKTFGTLGDQFATLFKPGK